MTKRKVIKLGGSVWEQLDARYFEEWKAWVETGNELLIVHGGGPLLSSYCEQEGIKPVFRDGVRVTTDGVLLGARRILAGEVQSGIVQQLNQAGIPAVGMSGLDGASVHGKKVKGLGAVGQITHIHPRLFTVLSTNGYVPVVTSLVTGEQGVLNSNGDACAIAVAKAWSVDRFELLTDVEGVKANGDYQSEITSAAIEAAIASGEIYGGMIPKVEAMMQATQHGISEVVIRSGKNALAAGTRIKEELHECTTTHLSTY